MTPEFSQIVHPFFNMVLKLVERLQREGPESVSLDRERVVLIKELNDAEATVSAIESNNPASSMKRDHFLLAKKGLVFWADELLTENHPDWKDMILEREIYGTRLRATEFYTEGIQKVLGNHPDVIEVWFLCLTLGFRGDIDAAFHKINRPLPGGGENPEKARELWTYELQSLLGSDRLIQPRGEVLRGELSNLDGHVLLPMSIGLLAFSLLLLGGLFYLKQIVLQSETGSPNGNTTVEELRLDENDF